MGGMPGTISKGRFFTVLDNVLNAREPDKKKYANRAAALQGLQAISDKNEGALVQLFRSFAGGALDTTDYRHLDVDWFGINGKAPRWWADRPTYETIRLGLIDALQKAGALPIDITWLCIGSDAAVENGGTAIQVSCVQSPHQLSVMIITPALPAAVVAEDANRIFEGESLISSTLPNKLVRVDNQDSNAALKAGFKNAVRTGNVVTVELDRETRPYREPK